MMNQGVFTIVAAIVGVVGTACFALWLTSSRVSKERAFDRRLVWCEAMMRAINAAGAAITSASTGSDESGREACWTHTIRLYEELIPLCGLREMYAPKKAIEAIDSFMSELAALISVHLESHGKTSPPVNCQPCLDELRRVATDLARIGRGHLRLERLPESMMDPSRRFLGSFRGHKLGEHDAAFPEMALKQLVGPDGEMKDEI